MTISLGKERYRLGNSPCKGSGWEWTEKELDDALAEEVSSLLFDDAGKAEIKELLDGVNVTDFKKESLLDMVFGNKSKSSEIKSWRVGEVIAEAYLIEHRCCIFPWPISRDSRKKGSSLPGADLVGIKNEKGSDCFAFGEVKTSKQNKYPPDVVYGRTGLERQIEDLRDKSKIRDGLVKYLGHRIKGADYEKNYRSAVSRYMKNKSDVHLFGVLVRDVSPDEKDVRSRVSNLAKNCPSGTEIDILAIYLPLGSIDELESKLSVMTKLQKGDLT